MVVRIVNGEVRLSCVTCSIFIELLVETMADVGDLHGSGVLDASCPLPQPIKIRLTAGGWSNQKNIWNHSDMKLTEKFPADGQKQFGPGNKKTPRLAGAFFNHQ